MSTKERIAGLFEEYRKTAIQNLTLVNTKREEELEIACCELMVHFYFPNLTDTQRDLLLALYYSRRALNLRVNAAPSIPEVAVNASEQLFMDRRRAVLESEFYPSLTLLQKEILGSDFLNVKIRGK
jgi:hypothetical protein